MFDRPVVDSVKFAREAEELRGEMAVTSMARLRDAVADDTGIVHYRLSGFTSTKGKPSLRLSVAGVLNLVCRRCLCPVQFQLDAARDFELVAQGTALDDPSEEADDVEQIYADPRFDVTELVEDEVILSLPMVSGHAEGHCEAVAAGAAGAQQDSPFSKLSALKRQ